MKPNRPVLIYLHKPTGVRYAVVYSNNGAHELHPVSGPCKYATDESLANAEVWERKS